MKRLAILLAGSMAIATGLPTTAIAHGVDLVVEPTQALRVQASYDSGQPMADAAVAVYAPDNPTEPWLSGTTDAQGYFTFTPDAAVQGDWDIQVRQAGHGEIISVPVAPLGEAAVPLTQSDSLLSPLQKGVMIGAVFWGCLGTALFFSARRP